MSFSRTSVQPTKVNPDDACICLCGLKLISQETKKTCPDHLKNWALWMKRRKKMHEKLVDKQNCLPGDLLMNSGDVFRSIREEKALLEYTRISTQFDKYRGNPDFWKLPVSLKNREPPYKGTEYFALKSKPEKNEIPDVERVEVPSVIMQEKDILPRTRYLKSLWTKSRYRQQVVQQAADKLLEIEPHKPDLNLIVIGSNVGVEERKKSKKLVEDQKSDAESPTASIGMPANPIRKLSLKINCTEVDEFADFSTKEEKMSMIFEHFVGQVVPSEQSLTFENTGEVALRINWSHYKKLKLFGEFTEKNYIFHPFKFDKRELLLVPGTKQELPIWFRVNQPGNHYEYWEINTIPRIWPESFRYIILLKGFAFIKDLEHRVDQIKEKLRQKVRNTCIKDFLSDVITKGNYCNPSETLSYNFSEQEVFESANLIKNIIIQSPQYLYNSEVIEELKQFYQETRSQDDAEQWNFSIKKLEETSRKKDLLTYFENRLALYRKAKEHRKMLQEAPDVKSRTKEATEKSKKTKGTKGVTEAEPSGSPQAPTYHRKLCTILQKLEKPSIYINKKRKKYLLSYTVLKTYLTQMFDQLADLDDPLDNAPISTKNCLTLPPVPDRLVFELLDETYILKTKRISRTEGSSNAKPKSVRLRGIALSDTKKIFKAYFSKEDSNQKPPKTKEAKKSQKGQKGKKQSKQDADLYLSVDPNYDPFFEEPIKPEEPVEISTPTEIMSISPKSISQEKYLIVYVTLRNAVDALVDTIESFKETNIPSDMLAELEKCLVQPQKPAEGLREKQESVSSISNEASLEASMTESQLDYFEMLRKTHWEENPNTQKYFIEQAHKSDVSLPSTLQMEQKEETLANVFSFEDFQRKPEPYCLKNAGAQTESLQDVQAPIEEEERLSTSTKQSSTSVQSKNLFYFLDDVDEGHRQSDE